jgi:tetratricopeptide (TPR) repeat protein
MYGAYLGIGVYKYWRYSRLKVLSWLPFVPDDRDEGIRMILYAITHDPLSRYMAMHQLVYILLDYEKTKEALFFAEKLIRKYPESQFMYWAYAHACYKNELYQKAADAYQKLKQLIHNDKKGNLSHLLRCEYKLAMIDFELNNFSGCIEKCQRIIELSEEMSFLTENGQETVSQTRELAEKCRSERMN